jgi:hypothetical protein
VHRIGIQRIMSKYDDISSIHYETVMAFTTSNQRLKSLRERVYSLKGLLVRVENQLSSCEVETNPRGSCG